MTRYDEKRASIITGHVFRIFTYVFRRVVSDVSVSDVRCVCVMIVVLEVRRFRRTIFFRIPHRRPTRRIWHRRIISAAGPVSTRKPLLVSASIVSPPQNDILSQYERDLRTADGICAAFRDYEPILEQVRKEKVAGGVVDRVRSPWEFFAAHVFEPTDPDNDKQKAKQKEKMEARKKNRQKTLGKSTNRAR